ncbi:TetR-like C-terminal domain-containing protein [Brevibacillus daliensis]|uniref:TetR-like C-terminal domain-containing protein n=1 Tax=Brevibacillus daliensis TaxID=2892995 RepID=UPI001E30ACE1|nr:TetR-like C-terminal domain-containing protein [Brevibacillus daliensis]
MSPRVGLDLTRILQVAGEMADKDGIDAVTLASLAKELHIRPPSLYNHVDGLAGLRKKLATYGLEQLYQVMATAAIGRAKDEAIRSIGEAYLTFAREHPGLYEITLRSQVDDDPDLQLVGEKSVNLILQVLRAYGIEGEEGYHTVRGLRSIFHGFASLEQKGGFGMPLEAEVSYRILVDTYLTGLHARDMRK